MAGAFTCSLFYILAVTFMAFTTLVHSIPTSPSLKYLPRQDIPAGGPSTIDFLPSFQLDTSTASSSASTRPRPSSTGAVASNGVRVSTLSSRIPDNTLTLPAISQLPTTILADPISKPPPDLLAGLPSNSILTNAQLSTTVPAGPTFMLPPDPLDGLPSDLIPTKAQLSTIVPAGPTFMLPPDPLDGLPSDLIPTKAQLSTIVPAGPTSMPPPDLLGGPSLPDIPDRPIPGQFSDLSGAPVPQTSNMNLSPSPVPQTSNINLSPSPTDPGTFQTPNCHNTAPTLEPTLWSIPKGKNKAQFDEMNPDFDFWTLSDIIEALIAAVCSASPTVAGIPPNLLSVVKSGGMLDYSVNIRNGTQAFVTTPLNVEKGVCVDKIRTVKNTCVGAAIGNGGGPTKYHADGAIDWFGTTQFKAGTRPLSNDNTNAAAPDNILPSPMVVAKQSPPKGTWIIHLEVMNYGHGDKGGSMHACLQGTLKKTSFEKMPQGTHAGLYSSYAMKSQTTEPGTTLKCILNLVGYSDHDYVKYDHVDENLFQFFEQLVGAGAHFLSQFLLV